MVNVTELIRHPFLALRAVNQLYHSRFLQHSYNHSGTDIFAEDWDNLVILDACRFDEFAEVSTMPGNLESRISRGSTSPEFIRGNFGGKQLHDVVYVSGNGWFFKLLDELDVELHAAISVDHEGWDAKPITEKAIEAIAEFPNKRLIVHYMHPHAPYVGPTAEKLFEGYSQPEVFEKIQHRTVSFPDDRLRAAYRENLNYILDHVEEILEAMEGKSVITADHGELLGERCFPLPVKDYDHPPKLHVEELVKVPWLVHQSENRKRIVAESPVGHDQVGDADLEEQLEKLGYLS
ncbi:sulfatase-like hydrolase/transferase [Halobacterium wangiae]|uniref:sulfatase-like hydrolase/transferase n=1 Tax=Halobacterium wangiae TaxID=2902623 RepID=UPI001E41FFC6|nr:sulfatase-like hydrolase/transferase [Halobacterium wangiae]